jgi:hypothetical protein
MFTRQVESSMMKDRGTRFRGNKISMPFVSTTCPLKSLTEGQPKDPSKADETAARLNDRLLRLPDDGSNADGFIDDSTAQGFCDHSSLPISDYRSRSVTNIKPYYHNYMGTKSMNLNLLIFAGRIITLFGHDRCRWPRWNLTTFSWFSNRGIASPKRRYIT